ncbi:MAG TPA: hypothetical protein EYP52_10720, partial [Anaerolineae bacterium]|nr:hypothetical protein [Anaerolineae bacterium]
MTSISETQPNFLIRLLESRKWYGAEWYMTAVGAFIVIFVISMTAASFLTPNLAPYDPEARVADPFLPPCPGHIFGTDQLGRDIFSRIIYGAQIVMQVALLSAVFSLVVGVPLGLLSGFLGGRLDQVISLIMDSIYSFPGLILAIDLGWVYVERVRVAQAGVLVTALMKYAFLLQMEGGGGSPGEGGVRVPDPSGGGALPVAPEHPGVPHPE